VACWKSFNFCCCGCCMTNKMPPLGMQEFQYRNYPLVFAVITAVLITFICSLEKPAASFDKLTIFNFNAVSISGWKVQMSAYTGYVTLIVNVASEWGLTDSNYDQLKSLHDKYSHKGLRILAFPCNQFGTQEPGTNKAISDYLRNELKLEFDLFEKIDVKGKDAHPLFTFITTHKNTRGYFSNDIKWNFAKFLVNKKGIPIRRFLPINEPNSMIPDIEILLDEP